MHELLHESTLHQLVQDDGYDLYLQHIDAAFAAAPLVDVVGLLLIKRRVLGIMQTYYPAIVDRAVELGLWTPARRDSYSRLTDSTVSETEAEKLERILSQTNYNQTRLTRLCDDLSDEGVRRVRHAVDTHELDFTRLLLEISLARRLPEYVPLASQHLADYYDEKPNFRARIEYLAELDLTPDEIENWMTLARQTDDRAYGVRIIMTVVAFLPPDDRWAALNDALGSALMLGDNTKLLCELSSVLDGDLLAQCIDVLLERALENQEEGIAKAVVDALPRLSDRDAALNWLLTDPLPYPHLINGIVAVLPVERQRKLLARVLELPITVRGGWRWPQPVAPVALVQMLPHLSGDDYEHARQRALEMALTLPDIGQGFEYTFSPIAEVMAKLAPHLEGEQRREGLRQGLQGARSLHEHHHMGSRPRRWAVSMLAEHLPADMVQMMLDEATQTRSVWTVDWLPNFLPFIADPEVILHSIIQQGVDDVDNPNRGEFRLAELLEKLAPLLTGDLLFWAVEKILQLSANFGGSYSRAQSLSAAAPRLTTAQADQALERAIAMLNTPVALPDEEMARLQAEFNHQQQYDNAVAILAPYCTPSNVIAAADRIKDSRRKTQALAVIVPKVSEREAVIAQILESLLKMVSWATLKRDKPPTEHPMHHIAPYVSSEDAIALLERLPDAPHRAEYGLALLAHYPNNDQIQGITEEAIFAASSVDASERLARLMPLITNQIALLKRILDETDRHSQRRHLEKVAPYLSEDALSHLLGRVLGRSGGFALWQMLEHTNLRADHANRIFDFLLTVETDDDFAPKRPQPQSGLLPRANVTAPRNDLYKGLLLRHVLPNISPDRVDAAFHAAQALINLEGRVAALATLANHHDHPAASHMALELLPELENVRSQISVLKYFRWDADTLAKVDSQAFPNHHQRAQFLVELLPQVDDTAPLIESLRAAIRDGLVNDDIKIQQLFADPKLCRTPIFTVSEMTQIADTITAIHEAWVWK